MKKQQHDIRIIMKQNEMEKHITNNRVVSTGTMTRPHKGNEKGGL